MQHHHHEEHVHDMDFHCSYHRDAAGNIILNFGNREYVAISGSVFEYQGRLLLATIYDEATGAFIKNLVQHPDLLGAWAKSSPLVRKYCADHNIALPAPALDDSFDLYTFDFVFDMLTDFENFLKSEGLPDDAPEVRTHAKCGRFLAALRERAAEIGSQPTPEQFAKALCALDTAFAATATQGERS